MNINVRFYIRLLPPVWSGEKKCTIPSAIEVNFQVSFFQHKELHIDAQKIYMHKTIKNHMQNIIYLIT
jgi:hypothetical protein